MGCCGMGSMRMGSHHRHDAAETETERAIEREDPTDILKLRLARGEITVQEYRDLLATLRGESVVDA